MRDNQFPKQMQFISNRVGDYFWFAFSHLNGVIKQRSVSSVIWIATFEIPNQIEIREQNNETNEHNVIKRTTMLTSKERMRGD